MHISHTAEWRQAVAERLRRTRIALGLSQAQVCRSLGVTPQRWNNWERGARPLDLAAAVTLCERHDLTLDWLYRGVSAGLPYELGLKVDFRPMPYTAARPKAKAEAS